MAAPMPAAVVLILCKTLAAPFASPLDAENAKFTGHEPRSWAYEHSMMICRRQVVQLDDAAVASATPGSPADPQPFNNQRCQRSGVMLAVEWDMQHRSSSYRVWRIACPVPIVDTRTGETIGWKMPECSKRDVVQCDVDSEV